MDVHVTLARRGHLADELYDQLHAAILDGRLRRGDGLPPSRDLARRLAIGRNTVVEVYERLIGEGHAIARVGAGTFVATPPVRGRERRAPAGSALTPRPVWRGIETEVSRAEVPFDFSVGLPDPSLFPWDEWRSRLARQLRRHAARDAGYPPPEGAPTLRAAIARHVGLARSVRAHADDVLVTSGAQQAFDLIARVLVGPGEVVAFEEPGYPPARLAFATHGARVAPVRVDGEGLCVSALPARAKLVYVTPSHQCPLGTAMSLARRLELLAWSERHGAAILEDDYDSEFRFDGRPLEPLQSLDRAGRVLYVGTFSKVLLPSLRVGFVIAPPSIMPALHAAKQVADSHGALEVQLALGALIDDGGFARHVRRLVRIYRERRRALAAALDRHLGALVTPLPASAGLHQSVMLRDARADVAAIATAALQAGIRVQPLARYYMRRPRAGLAFGYGMIEVRAIDDGIRRLAQIMRRGS